MAAAEEEADLKARLVGTVTVAGTNEPVVGATVSALTGPDGSSIRWAQAKAITDARGRYVLELPIGHVLLWGVVLPTGYWSSFEYEAVATTPDAPEQTKHYQVQRGSVWRMRIEADHELTALLPRVSVYGRQFNVKPYISIRARVDESGGALLTLPEIGGEYDLAFSHEDFKLRSKTPAKLSIEPGFQPVRVVSATRTDGPAALVFEDNAGRKATLTGGAGAVVDGRAEIHFRAPAPEAGEAFAVTGRIVDDKEQPLADALVALGWQSPSAGAMTGLSARTDETGRFTISNVPRTGEGDQVLLMVKREGFAGIDTHPQAVPEDVAENGLDFGAIKLSRGYDARLKVLDPDGKPVVGAWVEPSGSYSARYQFTRTDFQGGCVLLDLAPGIQKAEVRFGRLYANARFVVTPGEPDEATVRLAPLPEQRSRKPCR